MNVEPILDAFTEDLDASPITELQKKDFVLSHLEAVKDTHPIGLLQVEKHAMDVMPLFPAKLGQTECKSEEDDGYCSRSSLDSPVQMSQSDSEAGDVFASKDCCPQQDQNISDDTVQEFSIDADSVTSATTSVASPSSSASIPGRQKILIVNKTANIKYLIPSTGVIQKSPGVTKTSLIPTIKSSVSQQQEQQPVTNLVNIKILKPGLNKYQTGQITLLRLPEKESTGTTISTTTSTIPLDVQQGNGITSAIPAAEDESGVGGVLAEGVLPVENGSDVFQADGSGRNDDLLAWKSASAGTVRSGGTVEVWKKCGGGYHGDGERVAGGVSHVVPSMCGTVTTIVSTASVMLPPAYSVASSSSGNCKEPLTTTPPHEVSCSSAGQTLDSDKTVSPEDAEHNVQSGDGQCSPAAKADIMQQQQQPSGINYSAVGSSLITVQRSCYEGQRSTMGSDKVKRPSPSNDLGQGSLTSNIGSLSSIEAPSSRTILKSCLSSANRESTSAKILHQTGVVAGNGACQLSGRSGNQDVTVLLLPQSSLQPMMKKMSPVGDAPCKQVVLRIGQGQMYKAVGINAEDLKGLRKTTQSDESRTEKCEDVARVIPHKEVAVVNKISSTLRNGHGINKPVVEKDCIPVVTKSASIGRFASLSLPGLQNGGLNAGTSLGNVKSVSNTVTAATSQLKNHRTSSQIGVGSVRINEGCSVTRSRVLRTPATPKSYQSSGYLHPLVDHDYCEFSAFCADVQSSIISLTDSGIRPERRYVKKNRAARTKALRVTQYVSENCSAENRPKRKYCKRKQGSDVETCKKCGNVSGKLKGKVIVSPAKNVAASSVKDSVQTASADDKDYVKIPGYYQDEFVYYATKRLPGRPRNRTETSRKVSDNVVVSKPLNSAAGISVFDWYKEMAQTDKTSRFGAADVAQDGAVCSDESERIGSVKDCTPVDESDVADLVMDMLPSGDMVRPVVDDMKFGSSSSIVDSFLSGALDMSESAGVDGNADLNLMAEEVRLMLSSMGEAELKLLESHLENEKISEEMHDDALDINSYLGEYASHDHNMSLSQTSVSNLLDVDDINDGDLLTADIANMNIILNDLNDPNRSRSSQESVNAKLETSSITSLFTKSCDGFINNINNIGLDLSKTSEAVVASKPENSVKIDKSTPAISCRISGLPAISSDASPPELTTINMFWNDLPGLLMDGKEFVRLVDIHKQIMPAKDTGILKKRCQMMGLQITNCTELQRDFLIRYMNAAKSKSTVIIAKDAAIMLIGFYVNPKSRSRGIDDFELDVIPQLKQTQAVSQHGRNQWSAASKFKEQGSTITVNGQATTSSWPNRSLDKSEKTPSSKSMVQPHVIASEAGLGVETGTDIKRSERLRRKQIGCGGTASAGPKENERSVRPEGTQFEENSGAENRLDASSLLESEQAELENLVREQKRRRLTLEEKLRLKLLRNSCKVSTLRPKPAKVVLKGTRTHLLKRTRRTGRMLAWKHRRGPNGRSSDLHTLEHCYAASPANMNSRQKQNSNIDHQAVQKRLDQHGNGHQGTETSENAAQQISAVSVPKLSDVKSTRIGVIHRDVTCRVNRRRRSQVGELYVHLYTSVDAECIRCSNCHEMLGVSQFLKHMHWRRGSDKLMQVTIAQKLQIQSSSRTADNLASWEEFQKRRACFDNMPEVHLGKPISKIVASAAANKQNVSPGVATVPTSCPSTRHSSRVLKRRLPSTADDKESHADVMPPEPKKRRQNSETEKRSPASGGHKISDAAAVSSSKLRQKPNSGCKKSKAQPFVASDRMFRVSTRRSQASD